MYCTLRSNCLEQINRSIKLSDKPSRDLRIHWLNPLLYKCKERLYPEKAL